MPSIGYLTTTSRAKPRSSLRPYTRSTLSSRERKQPSQAPNRQTTTPSPSHHHIITKAQPSPATMASLISDLDALTDDLPPTYTESTTTTSTPDLPPSLTSYYTSPITTHLSSLPARLRAAHAAHLTTQASRDLEIITRLAPAVETFLRDLTSSARAPPAVAELTLVPAAAVPRGWALSGAAERRREGEAVRVVRVDSGKEDPAKPSGGSKAVEAGYAARNDDDDDDDDDDSDGDGRARGNGDGEPGFDEWGRFNDGDGDGGESAGVPASWWYFRDEGVARRLAGYLQPKAEVKTERRQIQQAVLDAKKQSSGWRWGRKKSGSESAPAASSPPPFSPSPAPVVEADDRVNMTIRAMEVTFRKENDLGVWETRNGFGIVVTVKVKQT
ncbi:hypothetical protein B0T25DRAFT_228218 [Lasiosphaeria hispida]|uniref:Uncharacterized protein n=1 Tax=Lasiosphaeria hispida TaxID=260671 RepID=A0AAJ0HDR8_9PEZI|nr:hypothetical protein B0T25DRAFT_228218 [Lasiosphaeria hispida]